ncbi:hypothetical protein ACHAWX_005222, partial [Stephanocyclus meneghinianus]
EKTEINERDEAARINAEAEQVPDQAKKLKEDSEKNGQGEADRNKEEELKVAEEIKADEVAVLKVEEDQKLMESEAAKGIAEVAKVIEEAEK